MNMRATLNIDDELLTKASKLMGPMDRTAILSESLKALIERESAKRLAQLGGHAARTQSGTPQACGACGFIEAA